jgi:glycosyltransferase involved in cell wall biosynthesis
MMASPMPDDSASQPPLRLLRVLTRPNLGGPTRQAIALWHAQRSLGIETLLVTGAVGPEEVELSPAGHDVPQLPPDARRAGALRPGWLQLADLRRGVDPLADRRAGRELRQLIRAWRPHVVHTHTSKAGMVGRRAARAERVPVVAHTFHGHVLHDYFSWLPSLLLGRLERRLARHTDLLFAVSGSCADELAACRVAPRSRFVVTPPAVEVPKALGRDAARARLGLAADAWVVAAVGRLVPIKRLHDFVEMVAGGGPPAGPAGELPGDQPGDLHGDLLGDGPLRDQLTAQAERTCGGRLRVRGAEPDAARLLPAYDAVVLPSVREGCPLVAIEAFLAGVPVVGYDVPGVRDALGSVGRGLLVPVADGPAGLLEAVVRIRNDANLRSTLVDQAVAASRQCRPEVVGRQLAAAYRGALAAGGSSVTI